MTKKQESSVNEKEVEKLKLAKSASAALCEVTGVKTVRTALRSEDPPRHWPGASDAKRSALPGW